MNELHLRNLSVPFLSQRKNTYIWTERYLIDKKDSNGKLIEIAGQIKPGGDEESMAWQSCNITSIAMVLHYFGITKDSSDTMMRKYYQINPHHVASSLTDWSNLKAFIDTLYFPQTQTVFGEGVNEDNFITLFIKADDRLLIDKNNEGVKKYIAEGYPVIVSCGTLRDQDERKQARESRKEYEANEIATGHILVIRGYKKVGNEEYVIVNDPYGVPATFAGYLPEVTALGGKKNYPSIYYERADNIGGIDSCSEGTGDNCLIKLDEFKKVLLSGGTVCNAMVIKAPLWSYPVGDLKPTSAEDTKKMYSYEFSADGGYPLKSNNLWHNGIHIKYGGKIKSIGAGRLLAMRNDEKPPETGSNSFMLLEHRVNRNNRINRFYCTYMHVQAINLKAEIARYLSGKKMYLNEAEKSTYEYHDYGWLKQLCDALLPVVWISDEENKSEKIYKAQWDGDTLVKTETEVSGEWIKKRMMVSVYPVIRADLLEKLIDPSKYTDVSFLSDMVNKQYYKDRQGFVYFMYETASLSRQLCCCQGLGTLRVETTQQFRYYAAKIKELTEGKTVSFLQKKAKSVPSVKQMLAGLFIPVQLRSFRVSKQTNIKLTTTYPDEFNSVTIEEYVEKSLQNEKYSVLTLAKERNVYTVITDIEEQKSIKQKSDELKEIYIREREKILKKKLDELQKINEEKGIKKDNKGKSASEYMREFCAELLSFVFQKKWVKTLCQTKSIAANDIAFEVYAYLEKEISSSFTGSVEIMLEWLLIRLFSVPAEEMHEGDYYKIQDRSITETPKDSEGGLLKRYKDERKKTFDAYFTSLHARNVDQEIEIGLNEEIGKAGNVLTRSSNSMENGVFHFEIFSSVNLLQNELKGIEDTDKNAFFNAKEHTKLLIEAEVFSSDEEKKFFKYFDDKVFCADELKEFYEKKDTFQNLAVYHVSEWSDSIQWNASKSLGICGGLALNAMNTEDYIKKYYKRFVWLNKNIFEKDEHITDDKTWFYHPIRFLELISMCG